MFQQLSRDFLIQNKDTNCYEYKLANNKFSTPEYLGKLIEISSYKTGTGHGGGQWFLDL